MRPILIYSLVFPPDGVSTAQIYGELVEDLSARGHDVVVVSTTPHYSWDSIAGERQKLSRTLGGLVYRSKFSGIRVWHVWHPGGPRRLWKRLVGWSLFHLVGLAVAWVVSQRRCVVIVPSPLLTAGLVGALVAKLRGGSMIYNVQELYPDLAIRTGRLSNGFLKSLLYWLEKLVYTASSAVTAITPGMVRMIAEKGIAPEKLRFIPNGVDLDFLEAVPHRNEFSERYNLADSFVACYAGNIGFHQDLQLLIEAAEELKLHRELLIVFVGDGPSLPDLRAETRERGLHNVRFIEQQPYAVVPQIYGASDLCIVSLREGVEEDALPSKVLRIMACRRPILAICDQKSDLAQVVRESQSGFVVEDRSGTGVARVMEAAMDSPSILRSMGEAGRRYVAKRFGRQVISSEYSELVESFGTKT